MCMKESLRESIELLKRVINDPMCERMNLSTVKGYLGELWIHLFLIAAGLNPDHRGNQSGYDLGFSTCRIDVKTSTLKREVKNVSGYWGWALRHKNKQKEISCTHFVCVALTKNLNPKKLYVIKNSDLEKFPHSAMGQFKNVRNGFVIFPRNCDYSLLHDELLRDYFHTCNELVQEGIAQEINPSGKKLVESLK